MTATLARILDGLTPEQAQAAARRGPVLVLAGAGTGKTRTLTAAAAHRIAHDGLPSWRVAAVTFTNKAAAEMAGRIRAVLGGEAPRWLGTFHALAARQLRAEPEIAGIRHSFGILDAEDSRRVLKRVMQAERIAASEHGPGGRDPLRAVLGRIGRWKDELVTPEEAPRWVEARVAEARAGDGPCVDPDELRAAARAYAAYQRALVEGNLADFGDLLMAPTLAMRRDRACRKRWAGRFDAILVDEYQDINLAQREWLHLLGAGHNEVIATGDDDQAVL